MGFGDALRRRKAVCLGWPAVVLQGSAAVPPRGSSDCLQPTGGLGYVAALWVGLRLSALSVPFIYLKLTNRPFTGGHRFRSLCAEKVQQVQVSGFYHTGGFLSGWCCHGEVTNKYIPQIVRVDGQFFS